MGWMFPERAPGLCQLGASRRSPATVGAVSETAAEPSTAGAAQRAPAVAAGGSGGPRERRRWLRGWPSPREERSVPRGERAVPAAATTGRRQRRAQPAPPGEDTFAYPQPYLHIHNLICMYTL